MELIASSFFPMHWEWFRNYVGAMILHLRIFFFRQVLVISPRFMESNLIREPECAARTHPRDFVGVLTDLTPDNEIYTPAFRNVVTVCCGSRRRSKVGWLPV